MTLSLTDIFGFLTGLHPYDGIPTPERTAIAEAVQVREVPAGQTVYAHGAPLEGIYIVYSGAVEVVDANGIPVSILGPRNSFAERGLLRDGLAVTTATASEDTILLMVPKEQFAEMVHDHKVARRFFDRSRAPSARGSDLATSRVETFMARDPKFCAPGTTIQNAAREMRDHHISCLCVLENDALVGLITQRDLTEKALAEGLPTSTSVSAIMTKNPITLEPTAIGSDVLHAMMERRIGHIPIAVGQTLVGVVTQTDLTRFQAVSSAEL
ncbi:MAG: CBS domain-containing protein, partial [Pseudomonadota bacterium]|nr:CBS domain-containing protein [Pseudomonadota bacterium]